MAYPEDGHGDAVVVLELLIEPDGTVSSVTVLEGESPFAARAAAAAVDWMFTPARHGAIAVASRIRARVHFVSPVDEGEPAGAANVRTPTREPPSEAVAPSEPSPLEVVVQGRRSEPGRTTLSAAEVREAPGAFGDAFRAVEMLPGVTTPLGGVPYFFVRGAPPNANGYFVDGIRVPLLFHVGLGPGVIHPSLLDRVDFYPGAAPAQYGGFVGAIVAGQLTEPATEARGEAHVRLVDAGGLVETPIAGGRGTFLVAGRYGYPGPIVSAISDTTLAYWDYQARATWQVGTDGTLSALAFGAHDLVGHVEPNGTEVEDLASDFHRVDVRFDQRWVGGGLRVATALGHDRQGSDPTYLTNRSLMPRIELEQELHDNVRLRTGLHGQVDVYGLREAEPADAEDAIVPSTAAPSRTNLTGAVHADVVWRLGARVEVVPGARFTVFDSSRPATTTETTRVRTTVPALDPRLSGRVTLAPTVAWLSTFGVSHQYPTLRVGALPAVVGAGAGFPLGNDELQRTFQQSQGVEVALPAETLLTVTGFTAWTSGLTDLTRECIQIEPPTAPIGAGPMPSDPYYCPSNAPVKGRSYGGELMLRRSLTEHLGGLISYTLSRTVRESHFVTLDGEDVMATIPGDFDRTHVLNAVLTGDLGRRWRLGGRFVFYSGVPYSELSGNVPVPPYNSKRDAPYFRVDFRLEKRWALPHERAVALVIEMQNATLNTEPNTLGMDCMGDIGPEEYTTQCRRGKVGPIALPSIGVEVFF